MRVILYEEYQERFYPLNNLYPQFNLRVGARTIAEHNASFFKRHRIGFACRERYGMEPVKSTEPTMYLSARLLLNGRLGLPRTDTRLKVGSETVGFFKRTAPFPRTLHEIKDALAGIREARNVNGVVVNNIWDIIELNHTMLVRQYTSLGKKGRIIRNAYVRGKNIHVARGARVHKLVFLDATDGPVYIAEGAELRPFSSVVGPSYIGPGSVIDRARIVGSSIGPHCRIGGEVEDCIFQGYSNKHHEGFLGHSFIGEWVNLGAMTTNSDLKNNYGPVRVRIGSEDFDTGMIKLGCFIGDHSKLGIGTSIPTGAVIGSFVNFAGGGLMERYVRDFQWIVGGRKEEYDLQKALRTAQVMMKRRKVNLSRRYGETIRILHGEICRSN
jgi:UDP-N-acetylglucosamine diphosphorylase/glucosamine-1-phosphate N-acetyltransferase